MPAQEMRIAYSLTLDISFLPAPTTHIASGEQREIEIIYRLNKRNESL